MTLDPDQLEEDLADLIDNAVPSRGYDMLPVVGIGGSAGAIPALQALLSTLPEHCGAAFVVVLHLAPERESMLADILQRSTTLRVEQVSDTARMVADTIYVIPPGKAIRSANGYLRLTDLPTERGRHTAVDLFFRALADTHGPHAAAVMLSGGDSDGALGFRRIRERGGLTVAQDPAEAAAPSMPQAAIATGMVDWTLPVKDIGSRVLAYFDQEKQLQLPSEEGPQPAAPPARGSADDAPLREVLAFLHARTGRDFSYYKRSTIVRRIARRLQVNGVSDLPAYLDCMRTRPGEAAALLADLLVSVTNFFRDATNFESLEAQIPALFQGKGPADTLRVWTAACATGEEAYSLAILLAEHAATLEAPPTLQIFATDLDDVAVQVARDAHYPLTIEADVSPERLRRFFVRQSDGYRVRRELRDLVLFAPHDLLRDPPFFKIDLATCRNLLIYLDPGAKERALEVLAFALVPGGRLFLGASEAVLDDDAAFAPIDKKHRIYLRRPGTRKGLPLPPGPSSQARVTRRSRAGRVEPAIEVGALSAVAKRTVPPRGSSWGEVHLRLLEHLAPPSVLTDAAYEIVHASPSACRFLHYTGGAPTHNLPQLVLHELQATLRIALHQAMQEGNRVDGPAVAVSIDGQTVPVSVSVSPIGDGEPAFWLVMFNVIDHAVPLVRQAPAAGDVEQPLVQALDAELGRTRTQLRETIEQYEASTQDLKASNEELQAINEELRSATEELETSREELKSINEELSSVNHELSTKVVELAHSNSDMQNLMDATSIATVFLDRAFRITRYTPLAVRLFNLIPSDIGRPLADLTSRLRYPTLGEDIAAVLERLVPIEREVGHDDGGWFMARLLPYRTTEDRIAGVVLSFINITERKLAEEVSQWLSTVVAASSDAIVSFTPEGKLLSWNASAERIFGFTARDVVGQSMGLLKSQDGESPFMHLLGRIAQGDSVENIEATVLAKGGNAVHIALSASPIFDADGAVVGGTASARDVGDAQHAAEALRRSEERLRLVIENARDYAIFSTDLQRCVTSWNVGAERLLGFQEDEIIGQPADVIFTDEDRDAGAPAAEAAYATLYERSADERFHQRKDGSRFWGNGTLMRMHDSQGEAIGFVKILRDETVAREAQAALQRSESDLVEALAQNERARAALQAADAAKDRFIAVLSHELRNPLASITSAAAMLGAEDMPEPEKRRAAQVVQRQARSMKLLVDDLLDVSRLAVGQLELRHQDVTVASVVEAAIETAFPLIEAAGHRFGTSLPAVPLYVRVDPHRIAQAIVNLLTNAARYTPPGGALTLEVQPSDGGVEIVVGDNGIGMTEETIAAAFELYAQGPATPQRANEGLGVGLALVRNIVVLHGGDVQAFSGGVGQGSRFRIWLPLVQEPGRSAAEPSASPRAPGAPGLRILVADDNQDAAWALARLLEAAGHAVVTASSGDEALEKAERLRPDALVLDIGMPGMSGLEAARRLRRADWAQGVPLIALTGWGPTDEPALLESVFDTVLTKPIETAVLVEVIARISASRRADSA